MAGPLHGGARLRLNGEGGQEIHLRPTPSTSSSSISLGIPQNQTKTLPTSPGYHYRMMERKKVRKLNRRPVSHSRPPRCIPSPIPSPHPLGKCISLPRYACILLRRRLVLRCKASPSVCLIAGQIFMKSPHPSMEPPASDCPHRCLGQHLASPDLDGYESSKANLVGVLRWCLWCC